MIRRTFVAPAFVTTAEVAALLAITPAALLARRERLAEDTGFPDPMPTSQRPLRWRLDRILAWVEEQGTPRGTAPAAPLPRPAGANVVLLEEARRP